MTYKKTALIVLSITTSLFLLTGCGEKIKSFDDLSGKTMEEKSNAQYLKKPTEIFNETKYVNIEKSGKLTDTLKQLEQIEKQVYLLKTGSLNIDIFPSSYKGIKDFDSLKEYIKDTTNGMYEIDIENKYLDSQYSIVVCYDKYEKNKSGLEFKPYDFSIQNRSTNLGDVFRSVTTHTGFNIVPDQFIKNREIEAVKLAYAGENIKGFLDYLSASYNFFYEIDYQKKLIHINQYKFQIIPILVQDEQLDIAQSYSMKQATLQDSGGTSNAGTTVGGNGSQTGGSNTPDGISIVEKEKRALYTQIDNELAAIFETSPQLATNTQQNMNLAVQQAEMISSVISLDKIEKKEYYKINPVTGAITLNAAPLKTKKSIELLNSINDTFAKNIQIEMKVYKVTLNKNTKYGINWSLVSQKAQGEGLGIASAGNIESATKTALTASSSAQYIDISGNRKFEAVLNSLHEYGSSELVDTFKIVTLNNTMGMDNKLRETTFISEMGEERTDATVTSGAKYKFTTKQQNLQYGNFAMAMPRAIGNKIVLKANIFLSSLLNLEKTSYGETGSQMFVQQPDLEKNTKKVHIVLNNGDRYIVSGLLNHKNKLGYGGVLPTDNKFLQGLGGDNTEDSTREEFFVTIEAKVL